jgi:hypothetical protein
LTDEDDDPEEDDEEEIIYEIFKVYDSDDHIGFFHYKFCRSSLSLDDCRKKFEFSAPIWNEHQNITLGCQHHHHIKDTDQASLNDIANQLFDQFILGDCVIITTPATFEAMKQYLIGLGMKESAFEKDK